MDRVPVSLIDFELRHVFITGHEDGISVHCLICDIYEDLGFGDQSLKEIHAGIVAHWSQNHWKWIA